MNSKQMLHSGIDKRISARLIAHQRGIYYSFFIIPLPICKRLKSQTQVFGRHVAVVLKGLFDIVDRIDLSKI